ncbi:MAG TPA: ABC transporter ATP-binding protein [Candidatus Dormibacteraeota bacterium]|jgi:ABC-2 type transport system ATP-binding protein|nr:ABC transporter ATP-binding protein [Candidatus Dormibacteraeota bacterium]
MPVAINTNGLTKDYGKGRGLFDLNLEVDEGEVFGYLGPNGAGKTTTIRTLMGMIHPTRGSASIFGLDCQKQAVEVKKHVGYVPGELPNFGGLRGSEIVAYMAGLRGRVDETFVEEICRRFGLNLGQRFREYSRGTKQKLAILLGFMHRPRLLILDEPTGGLDPLNQQEFYNMCREAKDRGATVFLSSHILSEVEHISDRVGIIRSGRLVKTASLAELHDIRVYQVEMEFAGPPPVGAIQAAEGVDHVEVEGRRVRCTVHATFSPLMNAIAGSTVVNLSSHEPSLEEVFLTYYREGDLVSNRV